MSKVVLRLKCSLSGHKLVKYFPSHPPLRTCKCSTRMEHDLTAPFTARG